LKYLILGFLISAALTAETLVSTVSIIGFTAPDMGLLIVFAYAARGQGKMIISLCFLCGWIKGASLAEPAGFYIMTYILTGYLLLKTRSVFFIERPLTQFTLCLLYGMVYWLILAASRKIGILPSTVNQKVIYQLYPCISTAVLAPVFFYFYDRLTTVRRLLHP